MSLRERPMRYRVMAQTRMGELARLWTALNNGTIESQEPDGEEIVASMKRAIMTRIAATENAIGS